MRFVLGAPPTNPNFDPAGWNRIKLPSPYLLSVFSIPIGILTAALLIAAWRSIVPTDTTISISGNGVWMALYIPFLIIGGFMAVVVAHELLHCVGQPEFGLSSKSYIGAWPSRLLFYALYLGDIHRNRGILLGMLPFAVLSILPLAVCALLPVPKEACLLLAIVSVVNGFVSCGDLLMLPAILFQVPANAVMHDQGWEMYWKVISR